MALISFQSIGRILSMVEQLKSRKSRGETDIIIREDSIVNRSDSKLLNKSLRVVLRRVSHTELLISFEESYINNQFFY